MSYTAVFDVEDFSGQWTSKKLELIRRKLSLDNGPTMAKNKNYARSFKGVLFGGV